MKNWTQRLERLEINTPQEEANIDNWTLSDLKVRKMAFGKKYPGRTFEEVWADQTWIKWFLEHYGASTNLQHRLMIRYIHLKIEDLEGQRENNGLQTVPKSQPATKSQGPQPKPKAMAPPPNLKMWEEEDVEIISLSEAEHHMQQTEINDLQYRMGQMEGTLNQIMQHLTILTSGRTFPPLPEEENDS